MCHEADGVESHSSAHSKVGKKGLNGSTDVALPSDLYSTLKRFQIYGAHISRSKMAQDYDVMPKIRKRRPSIVCKAYGRKN